MADQLPIISGTHAINATATASTSLIGRGLSAIQRKETGLARSELDARYRRVRDIYNSILDCFADEFDLGEIDLAQTGLFEVNQFPSFIKILQQLTDVFTVFQQLANTSYGKAYFPLARMYLGEQGISKNIDKADYYSRMVFDWCNANQGLNDPVIWMDLGWMYETGRGVEQDDEQAVFCYSEAAEQSYADAQFNLGWMYEKGRGVEQDDEVAVFYYEEAAEQGHAGAQNNLGCMFTNGQGVEQDDDQAAFWYRKAAEQDYARAQNNLGFKYQNGRGVDQDDAQAVFWYEKAAEQGYANALLKFPSFLEAKIFLRVKNFRKFLAIFNTPLRPLFTH